MLELEQILSYKEEPDNTKRMLFRDIINKHHKYKKYVDYPGRRIDYFVKEDGEIIGCLGIASALLAISPRDKYIGWDMKTRLSHLNGIANNYRFCMIKTGYGSKVLSLLHRHASQDWLKKYGEPLYLLETLVEPPFTGTVYLSANWIKVGETKGLSFKRRISKSLHMRGSKKRAELVKHGKYEEGNYEHCGKTLIEQKTEVKPKLIFLKPLHKYWRENLGVKNEQIHSYRKTL